MWSCLGINVRRYDAVVVGGGIVGAACAAELAGHGMSVALVEGDVIGGGATAAGMGHLAVMDDSDAQFALTRYSQVLWQKLGPNLPADCEYMRCGAIWVAADAEEMEEVLRKQRFYAERGVPVKVLDAQALAEAEPNLRPGLVGGLLMEDDAVVYPPCVARFLVAKAQTRRLELILGRRVTAVSDHGLTLDNGGVLKARFIVVATGSVASQLTPIVKVHPRKGHLLITDRYPGFLRHQLIELGYLKNVHSWNSDSVAFNVQPRATGQLLIGSSRQYGSEDPALDKDIMDRMLQRALDYMPGLGQLVAIRAWTGFRAATEDKLPLIGLCPGFHRVYLATGHEGLGISTSLATAKLLLNLMIGRKSAIEHEPYLVQRVAFSMSETVSLTVNGRQINVRAGTTVAVAVLSAGESGFRRSVSGQWRGPLCGMGICYECRVTVNGQAHSRSCQVECRNGMAVVTG